MKDENEMEDNKMYIYIIQRNNNSFVFENGNAKITDDFILERLRREDDWIGFVSEKPEYNFIMRKSDITKIILGKGSELKGLLERLGVTE